MAMDWKILGHDWAVQTLAEHILRKKVRHAYLFTGPQGVGRRTLALRFAQALNCTQTKNPAQPCGVCRACTLIERMQHPDLVVVQSEQPGAQLKIDQVRELQHALSLAPYEALYRVAICLRFEEANPHTMNALLKTLEEPPAQVIILLTASNEELLLPTISSRCEIIRLRPLSIEQTSQGLQNLWDLPVEQASLLAHISGGRPGYARFLSLEPAALEQRRTALDNLSNLLSATRVERFYFVEKNYKDTAAIHVLLQVWLSFWRDVLITTTQAKISIQNFDREPEIQYLAQSFGMSKAKSMIDTLDRTISLLEKNVNPRLALEVLMLDLPFTNS